MAKLTVILELPIVNRWSSRKPVKYQPYDHAQQNGWPEDSCNARRTVGYFLRIGQLTFALISHRSGIGYWGYNKMAKKDVQAAIDIYSERCELDRVRTTESVQYVLWRRIGWSGTI